MQRPGRRTAPPSILGVLGRAAAALVLAFAVLLGGGLPAHAVDGYAITAPAINARISGPTNITVSVDAGQLQQVDAVMVRLVRLNLQTGPDRRLDQINGVRSGGRSTWATSLDPLASWAADGGPMANGEYTFEAQVTWTGPAGQQTTTWSGHNAAIDVAPPRTTVSTRILDTAARSVEVSWDAVTLPDFRHYIVQRAPQGGTFSDLATLTTSATTRFVDAVPEPGTWRYRVQVVRAGADGSDRSSQSDERAIDVPSPGQPDPDPDDPIGGGSDRPGPGDAGDGTGDGTGDGSGDADGSGDGSGDGNGNGGAGSGNGFGSRGSSGRVPTSSNRVPQLRSGTSAPAQLPAAPPQVSPGDEVFEGELPFPEVPVIDDRQIAQRPDAPDEPVRRGTEGGGTLSIYERELELEQVLPPLAGGLLMFVTAGHLIRLRRDDR